MTEETSRDMSETFNKHFKANETDDSNQAKSTEQAEQQPKSHEFIHYLKEIDSLKKSLHDKEQELNSAQGRNYELLKKIDGIELQMKEGKSGKTTERKKSDAARRYTTGKKKGDTKEKKDKKTKKKEIIKRHPRLPGREELADDTLEYYTEIAEALPNLKLSILLEAEQKFLQGDLDGDDTIDCDELEKILTTDFLLFTRNQIQDIMDEIDIDKNGKVDFLEVLTIIDKLSTNRKTKLPQSLQQHKSSLCSIQ